MAGAKRAQEREGLHLKRSASLDAKALTRVRKLVLTEEGAVGNHRLILTEVDYMVPF